jgi:hypothetical protein
MLPTTVDKKCLGCMSDASVFLNQCKNRIVLHAAQGEGIMFADTHDRASRSRSTNSWIANRWVGGIEKLAEMPADDEDAPGPAIHHLEPHGSTLSRSIHQIVR